MKILRVKHTPLFDVFVGDGWTHHVRFYKKGTTLSKVGKGISLSEAQMKGVQKCLK